MTGGDKKGIQEGCPDRQGRNPGKPGKRAWMESTETGDLTPPTQQCEMEMRERCRPRQVMDVGQHDGELTSTPGQEVLRQQVAETSAETEEKALEEEAVKSAGKEGEQTEAYDGENLTEEDNDTLQLLLSMGDDSDENDQNEQSTTHMMGRQQVEEPVPLLAVDDQSRTNSGNAVSAANLQAKSNSGPPNISLQYFFDWVQSIFSLEKRGLRYLSIAELANGSTNSSRYAPLVTHGILTFKKQLHKKNCKTPFVLFNLSTPDRQPIVKFCIFAESIYKIILAADLGSTIGVGCFHEFSERSGYSLTYCVSDTAGVVTVLQTEPQTSASGGGVDSGRGGSGGGSAAAASHQQQRHDRGAAAGSQQQHDLPRKRGRPPKAAAAQPTKGTTCAKKTTSSQTSPKAGSVDWHSIVLEVTERTSRRARELAKTIRTFYKNHGSVKRGHDIPTVERIRTLWDGNPLDKTNEQTTKRPFNQRSRRQRRDAVSPGSEEESEYSPVDSAEAEACDRGKGVELKYSQYLTFFFGNGPVYPVWKDVTNVVFCIPSISTLQNGNLEYDKDGPVFIHIAKKDGSDGQCAVQCSACDTPRGFWPKERYHGIQIIPQSSGFTSFESSGDATRMQQCKPLCKCAWALLAVPSRRLWLPPTSKNLWDEAMKLCGDHNQWPDSVVNNLGSSVATREIFRKHHDDWLIQVGEFGTDDCAFVKIRTRGSEGKYVVQCQTCGRHQRCYHEHIVMHHVTMETSGGAAIKMNRGHTPDTFRKVLHKYAETTGTQSPDSLKLLVKSRKPIPDVPEHDVATFLGYVPVEAQVLFQLSDKHKYSASQIEWMDYRSPGDLGSFPTGRCASWVPNGPLKDYHLPLPGLVGTSSQGEDQSKVAALFHVGGVVAVKIITPFDGNDHAVINVDDRYIFTWELIRMFLTGLRLKPTTYCTFVRSMHATWLRCMEQCAELKKLFPSWIDPSSPLKDVTKSLRVAFSRAVHGYVTLLDRDWDNLFKCRCQFQNNTKGSLVYDNSCNVVCFIMNRDPNFLKKWSVNCDDFHHGGGSTGKGHVNCGPGTKMYNAGIHTPEKYYGNMIEQKNSRVKALRGLVSCENQVWMMSTFRYFHAAENILQMVRLQCEMWFLGKTHELTQHRPHALFGVDGTFLPQGARHAFIRRGWEHPEPDCNERWGNPVEPRDRQMIGVPHHRATLATMLGTKKRCFQEFKWTQEHIAFIQFLETDRNSVLWLIRFECKNDTVRTRPVEHSALSQPLWEQQTNEMLKNIKLETSVRLSSVCQIVRNVLLNWAARNPEVQFIFPTCAESLRKLVDTDDHTLHDVNAARENSGQHIRNILDFDLHLQSLGGPNASNAEYSLSSPCQKLLRLILQVVDNSLQTSHETVAAGNYETLPQIPEYQNSQSWLLTAEWFPNHPVRTNLTGGFLPARRYSADEDKKGSRKSVRNLAASSVCNKYLYTGKNSKPGLMTVHCMYCCVNVGFSFLDTPESVRTFFNLFTHRKFLRTDIDDESNSEKSQSNPPIDAEADVSIPEDLELCTDASDLEDMSSASSTVSLL